MSFKKTERKENIMKKMQNVCISLFVIIGFAFFLTGCKVEKTVELGVPSIVLTENVISWEKVENADGYLVYIDANVNDIKVCSYELNISEPGDYQIYVVAYKLSGTDKILSANSNMLVYTLEQSRHFSTEFDEGSIQLSAPKIVQDGFILAWDLIHFATGYRVYFNGVAHDEVVENYYFMDQSKVGNFEVTVKAFSSNEQYAISPASNALEVKVETVFEPIEVNVDDFGAVGNGVVNDRKAIQDAVDTVALAGGGTVVITANKTYLTGNIFLKDNVTLKLEDGSMIKQSTNDQDYVILDKKGKYNPQVPYKGTNINDVVQFNHCWLYNYPLIGALQETKNVAVVGTGTVKLMDYGKEEDVMRMIAVGFGNCKYIKMEGFTVTNYTAYAVAAYWSEYVLVKDLTIKDFHGGCNDGVSVVNSSRMRVTNCFIRSGDDAIDIGTSGDTFRGGAWYPKGTKGVTNLEIDHNDTDAGPSCKGLAFFAWGGNLVEGLTDAQIRSSVCTSDVYIHNNKFATMGYWGSQSHDGLYGGVGTIPIKNIRFYDNEIGEVFGGFYYEGTTDVNLYHATSTLIDGDFEYALGAFWTTKGNAAPVVTQENTYGRLINNAEMYEGLYLREQESYIFSVEAKTNGVPAKLFARNLDTGEILAVQQFSNLKTNVINLSFTPSVSANYHVGVMTENGGSVEFDNAKLKTSYSNQLYFEGGSDTDFQVNNGEWGNWLHVNYQVPEASNLNPGDEVKLIYFLTIHEITDENGYINFSPLLQGLKEGVVQTLGQTDQYVYNKDLLVKTGKVMLSFTMVLPNVFEYDMYVVTRLIAFSGIDFTFHRLLIGTTDLSFDEFDAYQVACDVVVDSGSFSNPPEGILYSGSANFQFSCATGVATPWLEGRYLAGSLTLKPGDLIKIVYYFNITSIEDANATMNMVVKSWANKTEIFSENTIPVKDFDFKTGKISITYYARIWENYQSDEWIYPMLKFNSGVSGTWYKTVIAKADQDLSTFIPGYENVLEHNLDGGPFSVDPAPDLLTTVGFQFSCAIDAYTPWLEGRYLAGSLTLKPGDLIKIVYYFNITSIEDANATMNMVVKSWANKTEIFSENTIPVKDFDFKTGKISITYYARIWENYQSDEWIYPMLWFKSGVSGTWDAIAIAKADLDLTERMPEYENVLEHNLDGGLFSVDPAPDLLTTVGFQFSCATGVATPWLEGRYLVSSLTLKPGDLIKIVYYFNITSIEDANATMNMVVKSWANNENEIFSENIVPIKDFNLKTGKISITYYARVWENYQSSECIYPMLKFNSGVSGTWDAIAIAKADLDLTARVPGYENLLEHNLDGGPFSVEVTP
jgi:Cu/Ag efflux protein CusF